MLFPPRGEDEEQERRKPWPTSCRAQAQTWPTTVPGRTYPGPVKCFVLAQPITGPGRRALASPIILPGLVLASCRSHFLNRVPILLKSDAKSRSRWGKIFHTSTVHETNDTAAYYLCASLMETHWIVHISSTSTAKAQAGMPDMT